MPGIKACGQGGPDGGRSALMPDEVALWPQADDATAGWAPITTQPQSLDKAGENNRHKSVTPGFGVAAPATARGTRPASNPGHFDQCA